MKYDQHENCAKCGYPGKTVKFEAVKHARHHAPSEIIERLLIMCSRCGFQWVRDCMDKEEA